MLVYAASILIPLDQASHLIAYLEEHLLDHWSLHEDVLTHEVSLKGYFESADLLKENYLSLRNHFQYLPLDIEITALDPKTWQEAYKIYLKPWICGRLHWIPEWHWNDYQFVEKSINICLEPGMAFGTGSHETTRLVAMRLLEIDAHFNHNLGKLSLIDAGCGSGILALTAYRLGFNSVFGFDIDPEAVRISREHLNLNQLPLSAIDFELAGLPDGVSGRSANVILANIQTEILIPYAKNFVAAIKCEPYGGLVLSGILSGELEQVRSIYEPLAIEMGLIYCESRIWGEWGDLFFSNQKILALE